MPPCDTCQGQFKMGNTSSIVHVDTMQIPYISPNFSGCFDNGQPLHSSLMGLGMPNGRAWERSTLHYKMQPTEAQPTLFIITQEIRFSLFVLSSTPNA